MGPEQTPTPRGPQEKALPFDQLFLSHRDLPDFPYTQALQSLEALESQGVDPKTLHTCLLEDIIFSSLYATFYEHIFLALREHPDRALDLIHSFAEDQKTREEAIALETANHTDFVRRGGTCPGCDSCSYHPDVEGLIAPWKRGDEHFLARFFVGMAAIRLSLEQILYDILPECPNLLPLLTRENILSYRKRIVAYTDEHFF